MVSFLKSETAIAFQFFLFFYRIILVPAKQKMGKEYCNLADLDLLKRNRIELHCIINYMQWNGYCLLFTTSIGTWYNFVKWSLWKNFKYRLKIKWFLSVLHISFACAENQVWIEYTVIYIIFIIIIVYFIILCYDKIHAVFMNRTWVFG